MDEQTKKFLLITVGAIVLIALIVGGVLFFWSNSRFSELDKKIDNLEQVMENGDQISIVNDTNLSEEDDKIERAEEEDVERDYTGKVDIKFYENQELGLSFSYPVEYGEVTFAKKDFNHDGNSGESFTLTFSGNKDLVFSGISKDFQVGTSNFLITWNQGFVKKDGKYYVQTIYNGLNYETPKLFEVKANKFFTNDNGVDILMVDEKFRSRDDFNQSEWPVGDQLGAFVNLEGEYFRGFGVIDKNLSNISQKNFEEILNSIKVF